MKNALLILFVLFLSFAGTAQKGKQIYSDEEQSYFKVTDGGDEEGIGFTSKEIKYNIERQITLPGKTYLDYISKTVITTQGNMSWEGQKRNYKVELFPFKTGNPKQSAFSLSVDCDDLVLHNLYYETITYGEGGGENEVALFDYAKKMILEGNRNIINAYIPNGGKGVDFHVSFKMNFEDSKSLGTFWFAYNSTDRYSINIPASLLGNKDYSMSAPTIAISGTSSDDRFDEESNTYELWTLNKIQSRDQINNVSVKLTFMADDGTTKVLTIPVVNGKPVLKK